MPLHIGPVRDPIHIALLMALLLWAYPDTGSPTPDHSRAIHSRFTTIMGHIALSHSKNGISRNMVSLERLRLSGFLCGREKGP
jgi:hypothetical protein